MSGVVEFTTIINEEEFERDKQLWCRVTIRYDGGRHDGAVITKEMKKDHWLLLKKFGDFR